MNDVIPLKVKQNVEANGLGNIFNNFSNIMNDFGGIFSKFNLSSQNIEKSLKTLKVINSTIGSGNNSAMISTFSTVLQTIYKVSTIQEVVGNLNTITTVVPMIKNKNRL